MFGVLGTSATFFGLSGTRGVTIYATVVIGLRRRVGLLARGLLRGWFGPCLPNLLMRVPVVGTTLQTMALARLAWTLSLALNAGIDARRAIRMALQSTQSRYYTQHTAEVDAVIVRGGQFHEALRRSGVFSEEFLTALENAEITGTESESLTRLSEDYQQAGGDRHAGPGGRRFASSIWGLVAVLIIYVIFRLFFTLYLDPIHEALEMTAVGVVTPRGNRVTCGIRIAAPERQCRPPPVGSTQPGSAGTPLRWMPGSIDWPLRRVTGHTQGDVLHIRISSAAASSSRRKLRKLNREAQTRRQFRQHRQADPGQNPLARRRYQTFAVTIEQHVGGRGLGDESLLVQQHGTGTRIAAVGLPVRQEIVHATATFQRRLASRIREPAELRSR